MKKILCYGDSNVFGFNPENGKRFNKNSRWSGILDELLDNYEVIEKGLNNRVGFVDNPVGFEYSAKYNLEHELRKYNNIEILILAVGTNDFQFQYKISEETIEKELLELIKIALKNCQKIILIPPVEIQTDILNSYFSIMFDETCIQKTKSISKIYKKLAEINNCEYFNFNDFTKPSKIDGLHYEIESHRLIAQKLAKFIQNI